LEKKKNNHLGEYISKKKEKKRKGRKRKAQEGFCLSGSEQS
jgi:hypothetical protein